MHGADGTAVAARRALSHTAQAHPFERVRRERPEKSAYRFNGRNIYSIA